MLSALGASGIFNDSYVIPPGFTGVHCTIGLCIRKAFNSYLIISGTFLRLVFNYPVHLRSMCSHECVVPPLRCSNSQLSSFFLQLHGKTHHSWLASRNANLIIYLTMGVAHINFQRMYITGFLHMQATFDFW